MGLLQGHGFKVTPKRGIGWPMIMIAGVKSVDENQKSASLSRIANTEYTESAWTWMVFREL